MKSLVRRLTNTFVRCLPRPIARHLLKSFWYQPRLQDALRYHVQPYRFDSAIPTTLDVVRENLDRPRLLPGIDFDLPRCFEWLRQLLPFAPELQHAPVERRQGSDFWLHNSSYEDFDALTLYCTLRHLKPRRIIEVGCGFSSRLIGMAVQKNTTDGFPCECTFIEPYPTDRFFGAPPAGTFLEKRVEEVPLEFFRQLAAGDVLFIDTSHVIKAQNDCCFELLQVIPSLASGVVVHVHDIFSPYDYPADWLFDRQFPFNEQYGLECLLSHNARLEILLPLHLIWKDHRQMLTEFLPGATTRPAAFWFRTRGQDASSTAGTETLAPR